MPLPLWGELQKAQDDPSTIEDFINTKIAEHNANPEAHLVSGGSLEAHITETVIDHPAGSILADKDSFTELLVRTMFESLDGWGTTGSPSNSDIPGLNLLVEWGEEDDSAFYSDPQIPRNFLNSDKNMLYQVYARFDLSNDNYNACFGFFSASSLTPTGFGFIITNGVLTGYARKSGTTNQTATIVVDLDDDHVYRAYLDAFSETIFFTIDGDPVGDVEIPGTGWEQGTGPRGWVGLTASNDGSFLIGELLFSREV